MHGRLGGPGPALRWLAGLALALCGTVAAAGPAPAGDAEWRAWRLSVLQRSYADPEALGRDAAARLAAALRAGSLQDRVRADAEQWAAKSTGGHEDLEPLAREVLEATAAVRAAGDARLLFDILDVQSALALAQMDVAGADKVLGEQAALAQQLGDPARVSDVLASRAFAASIAGDLAGSLGLYQQALDGAVDDMQRANVLLAMAGGTEWVQLDPESRSRRVEWVQHALELAQAEHYPYLGIQAYYRIAQLLNGSQPARAVQAARQGLALAVSARAAPSTVAIMRISLARALVNAQQVDEAIGLAREALPHIRIDEFLNGTYGILALAHARKGEAREAMAWLTRSEQLMAGPLKGWARGEQDLERLRAQVYAALGQWQPAYASALRAHEMADQLQRQASARQAQLLEARFDARIRDQENGFLRAQQAASDERRQLLTLGLALAFTAAAGLALLAVRQVRQKRALERLRDEVARRNHDLQEMHLSRTRLLAAACHDLRQPAHALGLLAELASSAPEARERAAKLEGIRRCSRSLTDMLGMLMDLTRLEGGSYTPVLGPVSMDELLREAELQFATDAARKGLHLEVQPCLLWVRSDRHLLRRILFNLVANAVRYTARGVVTVAVRPQGGEDRLVLEVRDTGPGIPPERMGDVFAEFVRLDSKVEEGLGIGLPIVQRAATLLGHPLQVHSELGVGSCFGIELPLSGQGSVTQPALPGALPEGAPKLVLLLDDDLESLNASAGLLRQWGGFEVIPAQDAHQVQALAEQAPRPPDLLITDLHIEGGLDGLQAVELLRTRWPGLPALLVTGDLDAAVVSRAAALRVPVGYKPLSPGRLMARIQDLLAQPGEPADPPPAQASGATPLR